MSDARPLLGQMLLEDGVITSEQLDEALAKQESEGGRLGVVLTALGYVDTKTLTGYLARQTQQTISRFRSG